MVVTRRRIVVVSLAVYSALAALGFGWAAWRGRPWALVHPSPWLDLPRTWSVAASLGHGITVAALTLASTRLVVRRSRWARELHVAFRELLGPLDSRSIAVLALASGIGEEVFFRGALQPSLGLVATSLFFGLVHIGPDRRFLAWTAWAVLMGFVLGAIHEATGSLWGCVLAHVAINYENLQFIVSFDPREPAGDGELGEVPRLVGRPERR